MNRKIVLLPLDDRPCNKMFPQYLFGDEEVTFTVIQELGEQKTPADNEKIKKFLIKECKDALGLVVSIDMLLYGGLVPSRLHHFDQEILKERAELLHVLRKENPNLIIYGFQTIMRCPSYSSSVEEPDYYEDCGYEIYKYGELIHKEQLGVDLDADIDEIRRGILPGALEDYVSRRECNVLLNGHILSYVKDGTIDLLVFPQDDCSRYGYAALDQERIQGKISEHCLEDHVLMYPGADEVGMTLISRMVNVIHGKRPKVYVKYAAEGAKHMIPLYEGVALSGTIRNHLYAAGCLQTDSYELADIILAITATSVMDEAIIQPSNRLEYYAERNLNEFTDFLHEMKKAGKIVTISDNAYANGGDLQLIRILNKKNMLTEIDGYAGWNTSSNTLGTAIAEGVAVYYQGKTSMHMNFLMERYLEDAGYCSIVRKSVSKVAEANGIEKLSLNEKRGKYSVLVENELNAFKEDYLSSIADMAKIKDVIMPWKRMFEIDLRTEYVNKGV